VREEWRRGSRGTAENIPNEEAEMTTTPDEPVEDAQKVPAGDAGVADVTDDADGGRADDEPDPEQTVGHGVND
jgi:hypothetical protein